MKYNYKVLLAPVIGALSAFLAGKGLNLSPDAIYSFITIAATVLTWAAHIHDKNKDNKNV